MAEDNVVLDDNDVVDIVAEPVRLPLIETSYPPPEVKASYKLRTSLAWIILPFWTFEGFNFAIFLSVYVYDYCCVCCW